MTSWMKVRAKRNVFCWQRRECRRCGALLCSDSREGLEKLIQIHDSIVIMATRTVAINSLAIPLYAESFFELMGVVAN